MSCVQHTSSGLLFGAPHCLLFPPQAPGRCGPHPTCSRGFSHASIPASVRSNKAHAAASKLPSPHFHVTSSSVAAQASSCFAAPCFPHRRSSPSLPAPVVSRAFTALLSALPGDQTTPEEPRENGSHVYPAAAGFFCGLWVPELLVSCAALE